MKYFTFRQFAKLKNISEQYVYILALQGIIDVENIAGRKFVINNSKAKKFKKIKYK